MTEPRRVPHPPVTVQQQRDKLAALNAEMQHVGDEPPPPEDPKPLKAPFEDVLEDEIRELLDLDYSTLPANQRHYLLRAGVALWAAKNDKGPVFGADLDKEEGGV
jgi:hypothetical protein